MNVRPRLARAAAASLLAAPLLLCAGCRHEADERLGLDEKKSQHEFDPTALASGAELEKAVGLTSAEAAKKLGAHKLVQSAKLQLAVGEAKDALDETWTMEVDARGNAHLNHENSHDTGFETWFLDGQAYVRPRYGRFVRRLAEGDEIERARDEQQGVFASWLAVLGRWAARKDGGAVTHLGRPAHKIVLSLDGSPSRLRDKDPNHQWRKQMMVSALSGEVIVDDASGAPLHAVLDASYTAPRGTMEATKPGEVAVTLSYRADVQDLGAVAQLQPPADFVPALVRPRPLVDKQVLLDGLIAPPKADPSQALGQQSTGQGIGK